MAHNWLDKYLVLNDKDVDGLETEAAIHEFGPSRMPREQAEKTAHETYIKSQRIKAAAHHLMGQKLALAAGDSESAQKHGALYMLHMEALGFNPADVPPPEVQVNAQDLKSYNFKAHKGDMYAINQAKEKIEPSK